MYRRLIIITCVLIFSACSVFLAAVKLRYLNIPAVSKFLEAPGGASRPYGMAPVAWEAYLRACRRAKIHPYRIGQTIGNAPASVGYHLQDGVLRVKSQKIPYTAAVDIGQSDLGDARTYIFVDALAQEGFAAFYRHGGKWRGNEHIHAIYAFLPMKPQLQVQVAQFLTQRRRLGKRVRWERKLRRQQEKLKHWMVWR